MKLSISNIAWDKTQDEKVYEKMIAYGFSGLEIAPTRIFEVNPYDTPKDELLAFRKTIEDKGLRLSSMQSLIFNRPDLQLFTSSDSRESLSQYLKKAIDFASVLGIDTLVFGSPKNRIIENESQVEIAKEFFFDLGKYAYDRSTNICIEPNPKDYGANFITKTEEAFEFVKSINCQGFKMIVDLGTVIMNNESLDFFNKDNIPFINHIHISEPFLKPINKENLELHKEIIQTAQSLGYSKYFSIEMGKVEELSVLDETLKYISDLV